MKLLLGKLMGSNCRAAVLEILSSGWSGTVSELARRVAFSVRSVATEVALLDELGLANVQGLGNSNVVAFADNATTRALRRFLQVADQAAAEKDDSIRVRESLAALGAPLNDVRPTPHFPAHEAVVRGVRLARRDGTVFRVMPVVLARHERDLDWPALKEVATRQKMKAEVGVLVDLTARAANRPSLSEKAAELKDGRRTAVRYFPEPRNSFERALADEQTPLVAKEWGFRMNVSEESVQAMLAKHGG